MDILKVKTSLHINKKINQIQPFVSRHVTPFLLYVAITLLMVCIPIEFNLTERYIGHGEVVFWSNYFWWFDYAATNLLINPLHNTHLFFPLGLDMYDGIFPLILFIPITHLMGSVASYNIYVLSSFFLAAYGTYLLMNYLLKDPYVAFVSGLIFAFCPFHFGAAFGHLHTLSIMWIPFFALFFLKMNKEPTRQHILLSSAFFAINALTSWTIAAMLSIFVIAYYVVNYRQLLTKKSVVNVAIFGIISLVIMSPGLYLMLSNYVYNEDMVKPLYSFIYYSADLLGFITPSPIHPFFGEVSQGVYSQFSGNYSENVVFMGYSAIALTLIGVLSCRKTKTVYLFTITLIVFFILSLGPVLHICGLWEYTEENLAVMLPGVITAYLPFFNMIRVPSRYDIMVMFCLAVLAGYGVKSLFDKYNVKGSGKVLICILLSLMVLFEFAGVISTQAVRPIPEFYYNISHDEDYTIIDIPICRIYSPNRAETMKCYYEYQKVHNKKMFGGYWSRIDPTYMQIMQPDPVINFLYSGTEDIYTNLETDPKTYLKNNYNVEYIVLHTSLLKDEALNTYIQYLGDSYYIDNSVGSDPLIIYSTNNSNELKVSEESTTSGNSKIWLGDGWHGLENWQGVPSRWISEKATLVIESDADQQVELSFNTRSFHRPRTLEIYANDQLVQQTIVSTNLISISVPIQLHKGENTIRFHAPEGAERPCDIPQSSSKDTRWLSVAVQKIAIAKPYEFGTDISFGKNGTAQQYQLTGWSGPEDGFTWTDSHNAVLAVQLKNTDSDLTLKITAFPYLGEGALDHQRVTVYVNEHRIGKWLFDRPGTQVKTIVIPHNVLEGETQYITLELPDAASPKDLGRSEDRRDLALAVHSMVIDC